MGLSYLSYILLKYTQLQTLMEAELTMLPGRLHLVVTLRKQQKSIPLSLYPSVSALVMGVRRTCMSWCRTPMMPCVAAVKSGVASELLESVDGQSWRTSNKALPLSLICRQME